MSNATIRIKKRLDQGGAAAGAPSSLKPSELAFNEVDSKLYYGKGESGIVEMEGSTINYTLDNPDVAT